MLVGSREFLIVGSRSAKLLPVNHLRPTVSCVVVVLSLASADSLFSVVFSACCKQSTPPPLSTWLIDRAAVLVFHATFFLLFFVCFLSS